MVGAPLFTVLMPTHNRADVLGLAIRSVLDQSETAFELLVVGDGCTDASAGVVAGFDDPRIRWFDLPKAEGVGGANRNLALRQARGSLIAYAQHDDLMLRDHLAAFAQIFTRNPGRSWAYSRPIWVTNQGLLVPALGNLQSPRALDPFLQGRNFIPSCCVAHRREVLDRHGFWREGAATVPPVDIDLWCRIIRGDGAGAVAFHRHPTVLHFLRANIDPDNWAPRPMRPLARMAEDPAIWPPDLRLKLDATQTPQLQVARLLDATPFRFAARLRRAVHELQDNLTWDPAAPG